MDARVERIHEAVVLSTAYFPNIQYFSKLVLHDRVLIDIHETYQKQSYRNRCTILGANGPQNLVIPVIKPNGNRTKTKDIIIDYEMNWQLNHWRSITSAYKHSPFFEIFEDEFQPLFQQKTKFLIDWNLKVMDQIFRSIAWEKKLIFTDDYISQGEYRYNFKESIHPKERLQKPDPQFKAITYFQVFKEKHGFKSNLSFIDLLFNEGPEAIYLCTRSICPT